MADQPNSAPPPQDDVAAALAAATQNVDLAAQLAAAANGEHPSAGAAAAVGSGAAAMVDVTAIPAATGAAVGSSAAAASARRPAKLRASAGPALWRSNPAALLAALLAVPAIVLALAGLIGFIGQRAPWGLLWPSFGLALVAALLGLIARGKVVRDESPGRGVALAGVLLGAAAMPLLLASLSLVRLGVVPEDPVERPEVAHKAPGEKKQQKKAKAEGGSELDESNQSEPVKDDSPKGINPGAVQKLGPDQPELQDIQLSD